MEYNVIYEIDYEIKAEQLDLFNKIIDRTKSLLEITENYIFSIIMVDSARIHEINRDYRGIDRPTDVISFAMMDSDDPFVMMEEEKVLANTCDLRGGSPIMMALPYPQTRVKEKNQAYANLISIDYCGAVSEMSSTTQYINHENRLSCDRCPLAKTILGIAMAEMIHLQKLGDGDEVPLRGR